MMLLLFLISIAHASPKYGPNAVPLSKGSNTEYFRKNPAPDFWALIPYYTQQLKGQQCSSASMTMLLNAARPGKDLQSDQALVTIESLLKDLAPTQYKEAMTSDFSVADFAAGKVDRTQYKNKNFVAVMNQAVDKLGLRKPTTRFELISVDLKNKEKGRKAFHDSLVANEKSANDFLMISFMQSKLTGDPEGVSHIAPVAAYDAQKKLVLILDPDRQWYEPYWAPEDKVFDAIADEETDSDADGHGWFSFKVR